LRITAVHVTHDQQEAMAIADRMAVMQAGRILQVGDGESLYRRPAHPFVATFLGRVNQVERSEDDARSNRLALAGMELACPAACTGAARLLLRPEDIEVCAAATPGAVPATVARRVFLGDRLQLTLELAGHAPLIADVARDHAAQSGERVALRIAAHQWMPSHAHA
jgi:putative spermidine/putrescine transport system ATP-binding protein